MVDEFIACTVKQLPAGEQVAAAETAVQQNALNAPPTAALAEADIVLPPQHLALLTSKYWGSGGVKLTVGFLEAIPDDLKKRLLEHFNAWGKFCNVVFLPSTTDPQVRVTREQSGYWSFLGTDVLHIPRNQPTMCLQGFTMQTSEAEFKRVVRHEVGHTLGFPHEQQLPEIVADLDVQKTIAWGAQALGWNEQMVRSQILTPLDPASIRMTAHADRNGIMCYGLPKTITKSGQAIPGGTDIDEIDAQFAGSLYPLKVEPPTPPPPPTDGGTNVLAKILAIIAALKSGDLLGVLKILIDLFGGIKSGAITPQEITETHDVLAAVQAMTAPKAMAALSAAPAAPAAAKPADPAPAAPAPKPPKP